MISMVSFQERSDDDDEEDETEDHGDSLVDHRAIRREEERGHRFNLVHFTFYLTWLLLLNRFIFFLIF